MSVPISGRHSRLRPPDRRLVGPGGSRVRSPAHGETPCLSPFSGGSGPQSVSVGWQALGLVRVKKPGAQITCLSLYLPICTADGQTACLSPYLVPCRLSNMILRRPHRGHRTARCQRSRYPNIVSVPISRWPQPASTARPALGWVPGCRKSVGPGEISSLSLYCLRQRGRDGCAHGAGSVGKAQRQATRRQC